MCRLRRLEGCSSRRHTAARSYARPRGLLPAHRRLVARRPTAPGKFEALHLCRNNKRVRARGRRQPQSAPLLLLLCSSPPIAIRALDCCCRRRVRLSRKSERAAAAPAPASLRTGQQVRQDQCERTAAPPLAPASNMTAANGRNSTHGPPNTGARMHTHTHTRRPPNPHSRRRFRDLA